jgi:hypothetical protein
MHHTHSVVNPNIHKQKKFPPKKKLEHTKVIHKVRKHRVLALGLGKRDNEQKRQEQTQICSLTHDQFPLVSPLFF